MLAALIVIQAYLRARAWDRKAARAIAGSGSGGGENLQQLSDARNQARNALPGLLQEVGEQPLIFQEEGSAFAPRSAAMVADIDQLAYIGLGRVSCAIYHRSRRRQFT